MPTQMVETPAPLIADPIPPAGRKVLVVLVWITAIIGLIAVIVSAFWATSGPGATIALTYTLIPLPLLFWLYWWIDRVEPEPFRYKAAAFVWGAVIAVLLSLGLESLVSFAGVSENLQIALFAPIIEEAAKGLFVILTLIRARRIIRGVIDGILVAGLVALGFASVENVIYYGASYIGIDTGEVDFSGVEAATATFVVRGVMSPLAHPLFTSAIGIAVGLYAAHRSGALRWFAYFLGYVVSVGLHAFWNGSLVLAGGVGFLVVYVTLALVLIGFLIAILILRGRELKVLKSSLEDMARAGWLHPAEVPYLVSFSSRKFARNHAAQYGPHAKKAMAQYQTAATEAAFMYYGSVTGKGPKKSHEYTYGLLEQMWRTRPWLRFPPQLPPAFWA